MGTVVDTVVLQYFLLTDRFDVLVALLDPPAVVPTLIFDPDESGPVGKASSELARAIAYEERIAASPKEPEVGQQRAGMNASRLRSLQRWVESGDVVVAEMSEEEWALLLEIRSSMDFASVVPLGMGESACLAIGILRGYVVATDDNIALKVLAGRSPSHPYERIRKLLARAASVGLLTEGEANALHAEMRALGFWDVTAPFPPG